HFHGETEPIPNPSVPEDWAGDEQFQGGSWMLVEIDLSRVNAKAVRLNVSLPQGLVARIDAVAQARRMSRPAFLALAAEHEMQAT
ncbi:type II toxin-antitoxin system HicB family antitoxin, partial [Acinetobacter baumannii]